MQALLYFVVLSLSFIGISSFKIHASDSKPALIEEHDDEGFFKIFRERPETFTASNLKVFLKRAIDLYPTVVTYQKKGQDVTDVIYRRLFKSEDYYFTFLTRHNLINDAFFDLEHVKVEFMSSSSSGLQTKLLYNILLGDNPVPYSFRILYVSEFNKKIASVPLILPYQKSRTMELAKKVVHHISTVSGDWKDAVKQQAKIEKNQAEKIEKKSTEAKQAIEKYFEAFPKPTTSSSSSKPGGAASSSISSSEKLAIVHKPRLPESVAKSPPKRVVFNTAATELLDSKILQRKPSRVILEEKKQFQTKKEEEERVDAIGRRSSITGKSPSSPRLNQERAEQHQGPKSEPLISSQRSNTNQKSTPLVEKKPLETSSDSSEESNYNISQADIEELFEDMVTSE